MLLQLTKSRGKHNWVLGSWSLWMFRRLCWAWGVGLPPPLHRPSNRQGSCLFCSFLFWHPKTQTFSGWLRITANDFQFEATDSVSSYSLAISLPQCYSGTANTRPDTPSLRSNSAPVWTLQEPPLTSVVNSNYSISHVCHSCGLKKLLAKVSWRSRLVFTEKHMMCSIDGFVWI